jgi:hypothetical protein
MLPFFLFIQLLAISICHADTEEKVHELAREMELAEDSTWKALLHYARGRCFVDDPTYYLSQEPCSLNGELSALISAIFSAQLEVRQEVACRFPARISFLRENMAKAGISVPAERCSSLEEYTLKAPAKSVSLVFASENITHPMSVMGHVFLKFSGTSASGETLEHAASFFTRISGYNVPGIVLDGLVLGMPAFFALVPYSEQIHGYREVEGRNIFEYPIVGTDYQVRLIHEHVWELRNIKSPYLFVGYNCATVVYFLVSLANPHLLEQLGWWISPIDVVRRAQESKIINSRNFIPSLDWEVRFFGDEISRPDADRVLQTLEKGSAEEVREIFRETNEPFRRAFAAALIERETLSSSLSDDRRQELLSTLKASEVDGAEPEFAVDNLKDPSTGPKSSRISIGAVHFDGKPYGKLEFLPASHSLSDDNRRSYSESMLELAEVSLLLNPDEEAGVIVQKANLYGMESLVPYNPYIGGVSSRFIVGAQQEWDGALSPYTAGHVTVGLGSTIQLSEDLSLYSLVNGALSYGDSRLVASYFPEVGGIVYEICSMKTVANYRLMCGQHGSKSCYQSINLTQAVLLSDSFSPYVDFSTLWNDDRSSQTYELGLKVYF